MSDDDNFPLEGGADEDNNVDDDAQHGQFLQQLSTLEGAPRFLHGADDLDVRSGAAASLLGSGVSLDQMIRGAQGEKRLRKELITAKKTDAKSKKKSKSKKDKKEGAKKATDGDADDDAADKKKKLRERLVLPAPLSTPAAERVNRAAGYDRIKEDVSAWDAVVHSRRAADQVTFPLEKPAMKLATAKEHTQAFKAKTPLEQEVMSLLQGSKTTRPSDKEISAHEEQILSNMTLHEALEKKCELSRLKALQSYRTAKEKRQGKIKSKKYRKLQRKEREKQKMLELEELKKIDPEAAAEKIARMENVRILERANLRHRNSSKYLQQQAKKAKFSKDSQRELNLQIQRHRELVAKDDDVALDNDGEDEQDESEELAAEMEGLPLKESQDNPWLQSAQKQTKDQESAEVEENLTEFTTNYKEFWENKNAEKAQEELLKEQSKAKRKKKVHLDANTIRERLEMVTDIDDIFNEGSRITKEKFANDLEGDHQSSSEEEEEEEGEEAQEPEQNISELAMKGSLRPQTEKHAKKKVEMLDPDKFIRATKVKTTTIDNIEGSDEEHDESEDMDQSAAIAEAFADDDVAVDFAKQKKALRDAARKVGKTIDMSLPGWGEWCGGGLTMSKRKRKRFIVKVAPEKPRKDSNKGHLILNENKSDTIKKHKPNAIPFPYTSAQDFEASIRMPVGDTFVPRTAFKKLIRPNVKTKKGAIIDPMTREELVRRKIAAE